MGKQIMEEIKILENNFNVLYKEYKEYEKFLKAKAPEIKKRKEDLAKLPDYDEDTIVEEVFKAHTQSNYYAEDVIKLQNKLHTVYQFSKEVLDIPAEIEKEIENFLQQKQIYRIENGEAVDIDSEYTNKLTKEAKAHYKNQLKGLKALGK